MARRLAVLAALRGAAAGLCAAAALSLAGWPARDSIISPIAAGAIAVVLGAALAAFVARPGARSAAVAAERAAPRSRNLIVTASELAGIGAHQRTSLAEVTPPYAGAIVLARAAALTERLAPASLFPARRPAVMLALAALAWVATLARATGGSLVGPAASVTPMVDRVDADVRPPAYTGRAVRTLRNPERIELLEGSMLTLRVRSSASSIVVRTADATGGDMVVPVADGVAATGLRVTATGFVSLEPRSAAGEAGPVRLLALSVVSDAAPAARITAPAKDLVLPDGNRALDIRVEASDDIGVASLKLAYTKVSGSGERFTFVEGEVPLTVSRAQVAAWSGTAHWDLKPLGLAAGDVVVYRAVVNDARPGRAPVESDAFIAEVASPGTVAADGFALDPDDDRYALSQQMIVLKTTRLIEGRARLESQVFADSAAAIAAEQRRVRAEFVFMMGGEVNEGGADAGSGDLDETAEAEGEADILAGREANRGRIALRRATRAMSFAARELDRAAADSALPWAREAVKDLEEAFSRNRILLRALAHREDLDPARRLSGTDLAALSRAPRTPLPLADDARAAALRGALEDIARLARTGAGGGAAAGDGAIARARDASLLGERLLRLDPASQAMQTAAASLSRVATALARGDATAARRDLDGTALGVSAELRRSLPAADASRPALERGLLRGALADLLRRLRP